MLDKKIQSLIWWGWSPLILTSSSDSTISLHFMFISHFYLNENEGSICLFGFQFLVFLLTYGCGIVDDILKGCKPGQRCWTWWSSIKTSQAQQLASSHTLWGPSPPNEQAPNIFNSWGLWSGYIQSWSHASTMLLEERSSESFKV